MVASWLLSIFLALGPIYWLPGVGMDLLRPVEWGIFLVTSGLVFGTELLKGRRPFPGGLLGPLGFAGILFLWIPGLVQASESFQVLVFIIQLGLAGAFFWCFFSLARDGSDVFAVFRRAFVILGFLTGIALIIALLGTVDWRSPCEWDSAYVTGWGTKGTVWSVGLAMFVPVAALAVLRPGSRRPLVWRSLAAIGVTVLIASQLVSGGRAGLLGSIITVGAFALLRSSRWLAAVVVLAGLLAGTVYLNESCAHHLKVNLLLAVAVPQFQPKVESRVSTPWGDLTAHRIQGYVLGFNKVKERPLLGHGLFQVIVETPWGRQTEIHNLWLKWGVYTGIAAPLLFLVMVALILRTGWRIFRDRLRPAEERNGAAALGLVVLSGLVISMLEINIPIGAFQVSAIWWAAAGTLVGIANRSPNPAVQPSQPCSANDTAGELR